MTSYSKLKKADLIERIGQLEEYVASLEEVIVELDKPTQTDVESGGQVFDMVKRRWNAHGPLYNCRFAPEVQSLPSLASMADELQIDARARSEARKDRHGRVWVDIYPKSEERELFEQTEEVAS